MPLSVKSQTIASSSFRKVSLSSVLVPAYFTKLEIILWSSWIIRFSSPKKVSFERVHDIFWAFFWRSGQYSFRISLRIGSSRNWVFWLMWVKLIQISFHTFPNYIVEIHQQHFGRAIFLNDMLKLMRHIEVKNSKCKVALSNFNFSLLTFY